MTDSLVNSQFATLSGQGVSVSDADEHSHDIWEHVQRGLVYPAPYALFATFWAAGDGSELTRDMLCRVAAAVRDIIDRTDGDQSNTTAVIGVGFRRWARWCAEDGTTLPKGMRLQFEDPAEPLTSTVFERSAGTFRDSAGDLWFHIKSDGEERCREVFDCLVELLAPVVDPERTKYQEAETRSNRPGKRGGKVVGSRFSETLNNPTDPVTLARSVVVGAEDPDHAGASFALAQRFAINWEHVLDMSPQGIEDMVGRTTSDILVPSREERSHIKRSRVQDEHGDTTPVLRLSLPYGRSAAVDDDALLEKGASTRDEAGIYFAAFSCDVKVLESIMDRQIGDEAGFMSDRLLTNVHSDLGGFFYIPSHDELFQEPLRIGALADTDWENFPGVNWNRLDRHFDLRSDNGYMSYNHKDYLFRMATMTGEDRETYLPPSRRVLSLLATSFSLWQDNWYVDRTQEELRHLTDYLSRRFDDAEVARIMALPVVERMGWTIKVSLGEVFAGDEYGFRGRRRLPDGRWVNGADTYTINPEELIVGGMRRWASARAASSSTTPARTSSCPTSSSA